MKININKNIVDFMPENAQETEDVEKLWRMLVGCVSDSKKLSPIGEYIPSKKNTASFYIEDLQSDDSKAGEGGVYYCGICNKMVTLKAGDEIPLCCGQLMKSVD